MRLPESVVLFAIGVGLLFAPLSAHPQSSFNPAKLAEMEFAITIAIAENHLPGAVLWIERNGRVHSKAYGRRALTPQVEPMTEDTIFDAASLTKVLAGMPAVMLLVERGQIDLEAPARRYLPEFKGDGKEAITIRQLLTHTSGLRPGIARNPPWKGADAAIRLACAEKLQSPPGAVFRYSDINFFLLGEIVQRVSGRRLEEFCAREIYQPLRMIDTGYLPPREKLQRIAPTEPADGVMLRGTVHDPTARLMGGVAGHAGVFTTAADLARYARMLLNGGELDGARVFKPETVARMIAVHTPTNLLARRGLGWDIDTGYSRPRGRLFPLGSFGHTGFTGTALWIDPFSKTFWIFLSNRVHPDGKGNILPLQYTLGTLAAEAIEGFDFANVSGALPARTNYFAGLASSNMPPATNQVAPAVSAPRPLFVPTPAHLQIPVVLNGIDALAKQNFAPLRKLRIGLITNHTGQDRWRNPTIDLLKNAPGVELKALFSPEHGIRGELDENVSDSVDARTGLPVYSLYGTRRVPAPEQLDGLDALVFDVQDIGCRFYTYVATMGNCLEAAAKAGLKFFVLDRVNPIGGVAVEGPVYQGDPQFVAWHAVPLRHGMTVGELAKMFNAERGFHADLTVIPCERWNRGAWFDETALPWRNPSPNMRSLTAAALYPGLGLHESAISVGRGTDKPFEQLGAPYVEDVLLASELNKAGLAGVRFVPVRFTPTYSTFKNQECGGASIVVTDRDKLQAVDLGIVIALTLRRLNPNEYALDKIAPLLRDPATLEAIKSGQTLAAIKRSWEVDLKAFKKRREKFLIYK
ncbi:MAG TPA: exo-beta-N-acetylmuramidase NamZ domain-containing protein [Verrucomicrobiae bacterium]|nr:exo-beta-N-acetylmuramidase NamZ domain-containing protein [Verrucomicrobiae bacterium]